MTATYNAVHGRLATKRGRARDQTCPCGRQAQDWAYQHTGEVLYSPAGQVYSADLDDYVAMCRKCHRKLDREMTPERMVAGAKATRERYLADPEFAARMRATGAAGRAATRKRFLADPEFAAKQLMNLTKNGGAAGRAAGASAAGGKATSSIRRWCLACGLESNPAGIGTHQKFNGHDLIGYEDRKVQQ